MLEIHVNEARVAESIFEDALEERRGPGSLRHAIEGYKDLESQAQHALVHQCGMAGYTVVFPGDKERLSPYLAHTTRSIGEMRKIVFTTSSMLQLMNGDILIVGEGMMFNHSANVRGSIAGLESALKVLQEELGRGVDRQHDNVLREAGPSKLAFRTDFMYSGPTCRVWSLENRNR